jgi:putative transposase
LPCTNSIENMMGTVRRNVKRWQNAALVASLDCRRCAGGAKGFRRLKANKQLPVLRVGACSTQCHTRRHEIG